MFAKYFFAQSIILSIILEKYCQNDLGLRNKSSSYTPHRFKPTLNFHTRPKSIKILKAHFLLEALGFLGNYGFNVHSQMDFFDVQWFFELWLQASLSKRQYLQILPAPPCEMKSKILF